ncbi:hypothetical protein PENSPDRAFT_179746 [Peniophora sp. CONT]|nr:hypothetical protein PENSPDRAFT_179746 [Peniophora sp. CONT]
MTPRCVLEVIRCRRRGYPRSGSQLDRETMFYQYKFKYGSICGERGVGPGWMNVMRIDLLVTLLAQQQLSNNPNCTTRVVHLLNTNVHPVRLHSLAKARQAHMRPKPGRASQTRTGYRGNHSDQRRRRVRRPERREDFSVQIFRRRRIYISSLVRRVQSALACARPHSNERGLGYSPVRNVRPIDLWPPSYRKARSVLSLRRK